MKAQLFSLDFLVATSIFILLIGVIIFVWFSIPSSRITELESKANSVSDYLVVKRLGNENLLSCPTISNLSNSSLYNYSALKVELNAAPYDIWTQFLNKSVMCNGNLTNFGVYLNNSTHTASVVRIVLVGQEKMPMIVRLYE